MLHEKDYLLRMIRQLAEMLKRLTEKGRQTDDHTILEDFLVELTGIPADLLQKSQWQAYGQMVALIPDPNRRFLAAKALLEIGKAREDATCRKIALDLARGVNPKEIEEELRVFDESH